MIVAGYALDGGPAVVMLAAATGQEMWRYDGVWATDVSLSGTTGARSWSHEQIVDLEERQAVRIAVRPDGDVLASESAARVVRLAQSDGAVRWATTVGCKAGDQGTLAIDGAGDVLAIAGAYGCFDPAKPDGIVSLSFRAGGRGRASMVARSRGGKLALPLAPLSGPVMMQLRRLDGSGPCWDAIHGVVRTNRVNRFVATNE